MSEWVQRIIGHPAWDAMKQLGAALDRAAAREGNAAAAIDGIERVRSVLTYSGRQLAATDPGLAWPGLLDGVNKHATAAATEIDAYASDADMGHIANANARADNLMTAVAAAPVVRATEDFTSISESLGTYRLRLHNYLSETEELRTGVAAKLQELTAQAASVETTLNEEQTRLSTVFSEQQARFAEAQETRSREFSTSQAERQERINTAVTEQLAQFSAAQEQRLKEHADAQSDRASRFATLTEEYTKRLAEQNAEFTNDRKQALGKYEEDLARMLVAHEDKAKAVLAEVDKQRAAVEKVVGVIGNLGVTSGYLKTANHALRALYLWQALTVLALVGLIVVAIFIATSTGTGDAEFYRAFAGRVFLSVTVGVFAAYAARQAANFWQVERRNRKLALELEALGPYIAPLPVDQQNKFREEVGQRSFGVPDNDGAKALETPRDPVTVLDLVKMKEVREFIVDIVKATK